MLNICRLAKYQNKHIYVYVYSTHTHTYIITALLLCKISNKAMFKLITLVLISLISSQRKNLGIIFEK